MLMSIAKNILKRLRVKFRVKFPGGFVAFRSVIDFATSFVCIIIVIIFIKVYSYL